MTVASAATPPVVSDLPPKIGRWRVFARNPASIVGLLIFAALIAMTGAGMVATPFDPEHVGAGPAMAPPGIEHWMGTDELGRDVFSRILVGIRVSLLVGIVAAAISTGLGIVVGSLSGFYGGRIDDLLMRITEIFQVIPRFFLAVILVAFFGARLINIILAIALLSWPEIARIVRAEFLTLRTRQFVDAARVAGAATATLIFAEILPNALAAVVVNGTLQVGQAMLLEAGLSYLGLGDPSQVSLGLMLHQAQSIMRSAWWTTAVPGVMIFLAVVSLNLFGDGLNDVLNPRLRGR
jgi:peptide/nickel transport system permease protein